MLLLSRFPVLGSETFPQALKLLKMMAMLSSYLPDTPLIAFTALLLVTLTIPPLFERLHLPGLVGLLLAGVLLGPNVLQVLTPTGEVEKLLSDVGKVYLMFVVGLEIDLQEFQANRNRALGFGLTTFLVPLLLGTGVGRWFGYGWNGAILIGSLMSSHTLLAYPIVHRLGVAREQSITVTVGATIFTDIAALLVLALCVSASQGDLSLLSLIIQVGTLGLYTILILFGLQWAGRAYFKRSRNDQSNEFLFVLLAVFLASVGAILINVDKIVGAFLAGLAVNKVLGEGPVKEKVEFVGGALFIPFFFVCMGLQLDLPIFINTLTQDLGLAIAIVLTLVTSKLLAAIAIKWPYGYSWLQVTTMWSLSLPQVAATLAAALVGLQTGLIDEKLFNSVIVLMLITSIIGPVLTTRTASLLPKPKVIDRIREDGQSLPIKVTPPSDNLDGAIAPMPFTVIVPVSNPGTERNLIEMAALIARPQAGLIVPLAITPAHVHMDEPELTQILAQNTMLLHQAQAISQEFQVKATPRIRIDNDIAHGISRAAREQNANLIVMGWSHQTGLRARLFGTLIDSVFWASHCPVVVTRLLDAPIKIRRILVPIRNITPQTLHTVQFAQKFAENAQASIRLLHVCDPPTPIAQIRLFEANLTKIIGHTHQAARVSIKSIRHDNPALVIVRAARHTDLIVMRSTRRRTAGGLAVSDVTHAVLADLNCSIVLFGEPHS